jgi:hypothetical protein
MPGFLLHVGATAQCSHVGSASPMTPNARVLVSSQPTVTLPTLYTVAGCPNPPVSGGPCLTAQFTTSAVRLLSNGVPLLLFDSLAMCAPTGVPLQIVSTQTRVTGT